ncbi:hypothetical protein RRSWK_05280 [Rhodopirellula sp. SWK7]|nr:hypothetical protein RRSWK_05280 [Rhodopirellula sp. SWK7]
MIREKKTDVFPPDNTTIQTDDESHAAWRSRVRLIDGESGVLSLRYGILAMSPELESVQTELTSLLPSCNAAGS